jgi:hypothetical protein
MNGNSGPTNSLLQLTIVSALFATPAALLWIDVLLQSAQFEIFLHTIRFLGSLIPLAVALVVTLMSLWIVSWQRPEEGVVRSTEQVNPRREVARFTKNFPSGGHQ